MFLSNDALTQERMNRLAFMGRRAFPAYDVDDSLVINVAAKAIDGVALTTSASTLYTVPASLVAVTEVLSIFLVNTDTTERAVSVDIVQSGGSIGASTAIFRDTVSPGEPVLLEGPWHLAPGDTIRASASAAGVVSIRGEVLEYRTNAPGVALKVINGAALGTGLATYYTVPASLVTHSVLLAASICNTDTTARTPNVHVIPSAGAAAVANRIWSGQLAAGEATIIGPNAVMKPGDFIQGKADAASVVGLRLTIVEFQ